MKGRPSLYVQYFCNLPWTDVDPSNVHIQNKLDSGLWPLLKMGAENILITPDWSLIASHRLSWIAITEGPLALKQGSAFELGPPKP